LSILTEATSLGPVNNNAAPIRYDPNIYVECFGADDGSGRVTAPKEIQMATSHDFNGLAAIFHIPPCLPWAS